MNGVVPTRRLRLAGLVLTLIAGLAGCTLPGSFFRPRSMDNPAVQAQFDLQPLSAEAIQRFDTPSARITVPTALEAVPAASFDRIDVDDKLTISVFEPNTGGQSVLGGNGGHTELLSNSPVDASGRINVPFVGQVDAKGLTVDQLRDVLRARLRRVVLDPQVQVRVEERASQMLTVQGLAGKGGRLALDRRMQRLSHLLAVVAPDQKNPEMLQVSLRRGSTDFRARLSDIYEDPRLDIPLQAGDSVVLSEVVQTVNVLGAVNQQGALRIPRRHFTALDAIAQAQGMDEERADPSAVYLFKQAELDASAREHRRPVIYQLDLRQPQGILLARRMPVDNNDTILIGDASFTDVRTVATSLNSILIGTSRVIDLIKR